MAAPSSPGFVGTFQALVVKSLEAFGIDRTVAFTYSLGFHAVNYLSVTIVGFVCFFREGLSWKELERSEKKLEREMADGVPPRDGYAERVLSICGPDCA